jgi:uncharacterized protein (TIGR02646 family)
MPLIESEYRYLRYEISTIEKIIKSSAYSHKDWGEDKIRSIRKNLRDFYRNGQKGKCAYCMKEVSLVAAVNAQIEHIAPKSLHLNFMFEPKNLCVVCADCNQIKLNQESMEELPDTLVNCNRRYPRSSGAFKIVHPHFDDYEDHILVKGKVYIDLTKKGAFTIAACSLNRYYHKFGRKNHTVEDNELVECMEEFMSCQNSVDRVKVLENLKNILLDI